MPVLGVHILGLKTNLKMKQHHNPQQWQQQSRIFFLLIFIGLLTTMFMQIKLFLLKTLVPEKRGPRVPLFKPSYPLYYQVSTIASQVSVET